MKTYATDFEVQGSGDFPVDMLRYDRCFPTLSDSAVAIGMTRNAPKRSVSLRSIHQYRDWKPTTGRWQSFGWRVTRQGNPLPY